MSMQRSFGQTGRKVMCQDRRTVSETMVQLSPRLELSVRPQVRRRGPVSTGGCRAHADPGELRRRVPLTGATGSQEIACPPGSVLDRAPAWTRGTGRRSSRARDIRNVGRWNRPWVAGRVMRRRNCIKIRPLAQPSRRRRNRSLRPRFALDSCHYRAQSCQDRIPASGAPEPPRSAEPRVDMTAIL